MSRAAVTSILLRSTPMAIPPIMLMAVSRSPAVASPFTYFTAPSMEPKKLDSIWILSRLSLASLSSIAPVFKSASMAICFPGMASRVKRAVTSATRSEPLLITMNWIMIKMINTMAPTIKSPPPTNWPKVSTTFPDVPFTRIYLVEDTFMAIRKIVVNSRMVG